MAGEFDGGFRQRQKQGIAKGAVRLAEEYLFHRQLAHFVELRKALFHLAAGFVSDALAERHPADRLVLHRVAHAPVDIAVPDIARVLFRALLVRIQPGDHCAHQAQLNREVQLVEQLILGGEIAKQRSLGHTGAAGDGRRRGGYAGLGESRGGSFQ